MSKRESECLKSKECFCGEKFVRPESKAYHTKKCELYQKYKQEYLTLEKINDYLNNQRLNKIELYDIYPYNMFCLCDYIKFFKQYPMNNRYYITQNGTRLTIDEIKSILNKDFLYQKYVVEDLDVIQINELLNNMFSFSTILHWIKYYDIKTKTPKEAAIKCLDKVKNTWKEKYSVENISVLDHIKNKKVETTIEHYGVNHHFQNKDVLDKLKKNLQNKYNVDNVSQIKEVQDKKLETFLKNYGIKNIFCDKDYIKQCIEDKYGVDNVSKLNWVKQKKFKSYEHLTDNGVTYSKSSVKLFDCICHNFPDICGNFKYATHGGESFIMDTSGMFCSLDFSWIDNKIVIEYNGDIWHANPLKYKEDEHPIFDHPELTSKDVWERDKRRLDFIRSQGYKVHIVWESDFQNNPQKVINECCEFIKQNINS